MAGRVSTQIEIQVPLQRMWGAFTDPYFLSKLLPKALPGFVESVEILEGGDSASGGSVWKLNFGPGARHARYIKERIESDPETHTFVSVHLEGGALGTHYSSCKATFKFSSGARDTTVIDWKFEYHAIVDDPPVASTKEATTRTLKAIEAYLTSNNELYS